MGLGLDMDYCVKKLRTKLSFHRRSTANILDPVKQAAELQSLPPPPQISLSDVDSGDLNMHQVNGLFESSPPPYTHEDHYDQRNGNAQENSHDAASRISSPGPQNGDAGGATSTTEWSSAVGHAMTGKSSRVIHTLQEDIARLTRECSLYRSRAEEAQRTNEALKIQLQNATERLRNSETSHEANLNSLARKDRKIEELRAEVQRERERRLKAEEDARRTNQIAAQERDEHNRAFAEANEVATQARNQYETLAKSRSREQSEYQARFAGLRKELEQLCNRELDRQNQLTRFDVIIEQKNREIEAERDRMERFGRLFEDYKVQSEKGIREMVERGHANDATIDEVVAQAREVTGRMRWVMRVKDEVEGAE